MDAALPETVRLSLRRSLARWADWSAGPTRQPTPERLLRGGRSNTSILVGDGEQHWVVRVDGFEPAILGLDRDIEWQALHSAARWGVAPRPAYREPGVLVCEYREPAPEAVDSIASVAELLRRIHALPPVNSRLDPLERAVCYTRVAGRQGLSPALLEAMQCLEEIPTPSTLCHNDLLAANRLGSSNGLLALDWEYAATGDPLFDLAAVIEGDGLIEEEAQSLLSAWLQREPEASELERLQYQRVVYRELGKLWESAVEALRD
jgi:aminoglycoside phosphotransferase (APT) family kinase protein